MPRRKPAERPGADGAGRRAFGAVGMPAQLRPQRDQRQDQGDADQQPHAGDCVPLHVAGQRVFQRCRTKPATSGPRIFGSRFWIDCSANAMPWLDFGHRRADRRERHRHRQRLPAEDEQRRRRRSRHGRRTQQEEDVAGDGQHAEEQQRAAVAQPGGQLAAADVAEGLEEVAAQGVDADRPQGSRADGRRRSRRGPGPWPARRGRRGRNGSQSCSPRPKNSTDSSTTPTVRLRASQPASRFCEGSIAVSSALRRRVTHRREAAPHRVLGDARGTTNCSR